MQQEKIVIQNFKGMHARATAVFVQHADTFTSEITVQKGDMCVSGKSVMGLLMLGAACGDTITLTVTGTDEEKAFSCLKSLIQNKFGEES